MGRKEHEYDLIARFAICCTPESDKSDSEAKASNGKRALLAANALYYGFYVAHAGHQKVGVCMHVRARALCLPLTTPISSSTAAPSPPPHTIVDIDACRTQCGGCAVCWQECFTERGGGRSERRQ